MLALQFLTPYFVFIPKATLSAVIICAVLYMIEIEIVRPMWRSRRKWRTLGTRRSLWRSFGSSVVCGFKSWLGSAWVAWVEIDSHCLFPLRVV